MLWLDLACAFFGLGASTAYIALAVRQTKPPHKLSVAIATITFPITTGAIAAGGSGMFWPAALTPGLVTGFALLQTRGRPVLLMDGRWFGDDEFATIPRTGSTTRRQLVYLVACFVLVLGPAFLVGPG